MNGGLEASVTVEDGGFRLDVEIAVDNGESVAVVGPNGAGKSTLLHALAGLRALESGSIRLDGVPIDQQPPEERGVGMVFQGLLLFPHLSALENVAFGLRARGVRAPDAAVRAQGWLERLGVGDRAALRPAQLSGGEGQRVALARALAIDPRLLLLDEPFAALDAQTRSRVRAEMARHLESFTGPRLVVTHDPVDAMALADRVVVLEGGRVTQAGSASELAVRPRSTWIADLVGTNLYRGRLDRGALTVADHHAAQAVVASDLDGEVFATIHPRAVALHRSRPEGSARNIWAGQVTAIEPLGERVRVRVDGEMPLVAEITPAAVTALELARDTQVWTSVKATEIEAYPA